MFENIVRIFSNSFDDYYLLNRIFNIIRFKDNYSHVRIMHTYTVRTNWLHFKYQHVHISVFRQLQRNNSIR